MAVLKIKKINSFQRESPRKNKISKQINQKKAEEEKKSKMELITFAVDDGFAEAILRGLRSSFITLTQYTQMKTSNNLTDLKSVSTI